MSKLVWLTAAIAGLASCGGNDNPAMPDGPPADPDAAPDAPPAYVPPTPFSVRLSQAGPDQLQSAVAAPDGKFYAAGFTAAAAAGPRLVTVVKLTTTGLDTTFGVNGVFTSAVDFRGGAGEVSIATQPSGKIVVAATVANATDPNDRDVAVLRLDASGALDTAFGVGGVRVLDLNTAHNTGTALVGPDAARGISVDGAGRIYVGAVSRGTGTAPGGGPRVDTDFTVARLTVEGELDTAWGTGGKHLLDIQESNATLRGLIARPDGTVFVGGYANSLGVNSVQPVVYKLKTDGALDTGWAAATGGVFHEVVLAIQTEVYNFVVQGDHLVTAGYGRNAGTTNDYVSLRFRLADGVRDLTWGGTTNGAAVVDPSGTMLGSNCRNALALPNGRTALIGSTGPANMPSQDAVIVILGPDGRVDTATYGDGIHTFPLGANGNDQWWGGAVSGNAAIFVGYKGGGATQSEASNDDAYAVVLPLAR
jgi:uncharacterized delta-60 repeat protein